MEGRNLKVEPLLNASRDHTESDLEKLKCKACGSAALVKMDVVVHELETVSGAGHDSSFYSCHVCGDNWLSFRESSDAGDRQITFIHQMGTDPVLKRVAHLVAEVVPAPPTVEHWDYYLDDDAVDESLWRRKLRKRRRTLKSICSN